MVMLVMTWSIHYLSRDYFRRNFEMVDGHWNKSCKWLFVLTCIVIVIFFYVVPYGYTFIAMAFGLSGVWIFLDHTMKYNTGYKKRLFVEKRYAICDALTDKRVLGEYIVLETDKGFLSIFWKIWLMFLKIAFVLLMMRIC